MCTNIGKYDRLFRVVVGLILLVVGLAKLVSGVWIWVAFFFSAALILTGIFGWCGLYTVLKINTCSEGEKCNVKSMDSVTKNDIELAVKSDSDLKEVLAEEEKASAISAAMHEKKDVVVKKSTKKVAKKAVKKKSTAKKAVKKSTKKVAKKAAKKK